jgi:hypothetical protein
MSTEYDPQNPKELDILNRILEHSGSLAPLHRIPFLVAIIREASAQIEEFAYTSQIRAPHAPAPAKKV